MTPDRALSGVIDFGRSVYGVTAEKDSSRISCIIAPYWRNHLEVKFWNVLPLTEEHLRQSGFDRMASIFLRVSKTICLTRGDAPRLHTASR